VVLDDDEAMSQLQPSLAHIVSLARFQKREKRRERGERRGERRVERRGEKEERRGRTAVCVGLRLIPIRER